MKKILACLVALLVIATLTAVATPSAAQTTRTLTVMPDSDLVEGEVVDLAGTGYEPLATVYFCQGIIDGTADPGDCGATIGEAFADAAGHFSATYTVQRFITPQNRPPIDCAQPSAECAIGAIDFFTAGATVARVQLTFVPQPPVALSISGSVTGPDGQPLPGADVWAYAPSDTWVASIQAVTDVNGSYELPGVGNGVAYQIRFGRPAGSALRTEWFNDAFRRQSASPVSVSVLNPTFQADAQLDLGSSVSGSVTDPGGAQVPGVAVWVYDPVDRFVGSYHATTGADGSYTIGGVLPASQYKVRFAPPSGSGFATEWFDDAATRTSADLVTVTAGQATTGIDAALANSP